MKKKLLFIIFASACLILCLIPSLGRVWSGEDKPIGNETQVKMPSLISKEGGINVSFLNDLGNYFEHHFAYRSEMISADAKLQAHAFGVSNTDQVITGRDGWLYYASTLNDHLGNNALSDRAQFDLANNMRLIQQYAEENGARFLLMVPPNKNSLYPQGMPYYYSIPEGGKYSRDDLARNLAASGVSYLDLFELFEGRSDVLYFKEDSHWNSEGARLVYDRSLDVLGKAHEDYEHAAAEISMTHAGDLKAMIWPADESLEWDYSYSTEDYTYVSLLDGGAAQDVTVEDPRIETECAGAKDSLLMYRDSYANNLIPFLGGEFARCFFSKAEPCNVVRDMEKYHPEYIIIEKTERNIRNLITNPGIIPAHKTDYAGSDLALLAGVRVNAGLCDADMSFVELSGTVPAAMLETEGRIYLEVTDSHGQSAVYEAFTVREAGSDHGFRAFFSDSSVGKPEEIDTSLIRVYTDIPEGHEVINWWENHETITVQEEIPFEKQVIDSEEYDEGYSEVVQEGETGIKEIIYNVVRSGDKEISRDKISQKIIKKPVPEITVRGAGTGESAEDLPGDDDGQIDGADERADSGNYDSGGNDGEYYEPDPEPEPDPGPEGPYIVSKIAFPNCADGSHGYYEITYSDGHVEYEEY